MLASFPGPAQLSIASSTEKPGNEATCMHHAEHWKKQYISNGHVLSLYLVLKIAETRTMWISLCFCMSVLWSRSEEMFEIVLSTVLLLWTNSSNTATPDLCESRPYKWVGSYHHHTAYTLCAISVLFLKLPVIINTIADSGQGVERSIS